MHNNMNESEIYCQNKKRKYADRLCRDEDREEEEVFNFLL